MKTPFTAIPVSERQHAYNALCLELARCFRTEDPEIIRDGIRAAMKDGSWPVIVWPYAHKDMAIHLHKFKRCVVCERVFYDASRNGRRITCTYDDTWRANNGPPCRIARKNERERKYNHLITGRSDDGEYLDYAEGTRYSVRRVRKTYYGQPIEDYVEPVVRYNIRDTDRSRLENKHLI